LQKLLSEDIGEWNAILQVAGQTGCAAETLRRWLRRSEGRRTPSRIPPGPGTDRGKGNRFSLESKAQAIRQVQEMRGKSRSEWSAIVRVAEATGCKAETLRRWLRRAEGRETPRKPGRDRI
jgi:transposase-like protein